MTTYLKILKQISKPHWFEIIELVKCSKGMSVGELSELLGMSYMGVKKHCVSMHKLGLLETWRRSKEVGRPEKVYRVTDKLAPIFPNIGNEVCLSILATATQLDTNAAEKLLYSYFRNQTDEIAKLVTGDTSRERAESLARARRTMGYFSSFHTDDEVNGPWRIDEYHNPLQVLFEKYPTLERMEAQMFERILGVKVDRSVEKIADLWLFRFDLHLR